MALLMVPPGFAKGTRDELARPVKAIIEGEPATGL
jgi:hypothetical protein